MIIIMIVMIILLLIIIIIIYKFNLEQWDQSLGSLNLKWACLG